MAEVELIVKWQQTVNPESDADEPPLVAHLYQACSELYSNILVKLSSDPVIERPVFLSLHRSHSYLVLWADGYGVNDGLLDTSLDRSRRAKHSTLRLLFSICQTLTKRLLPIVASDQQSQLQENADAVAHAAEKLKYIMQNDDAEDSDSDTSSDTYSDAEAADLDEIAEDLKTDSECLLDLGSRFDEPAVGPTMIETAVDPAQLSVWDPSKNFIDRIFWRYPQCDGDLAKRLGKTNWARVLEYQKTKELNARSHQRLVDSTPIPHTEASTKSSSGKVPSTTFHDSALGSSVPSAPPGPSGPAISRYAETVVSYHGGQGDSVRIPSLSESAKNGVPFACIGCGGTVTMVNKSVWKKHLFSDLKPYICLDGKCDFSSAPFPTKSDWEHHLVFDHGYSETSESFTCPVCQEKPASGLVHMKTHLARHLEEISLTILPTNLDSEDGTDDNSGLASSETSSRNMEDQGAVDTMCSRPETTGSITDVVDTIQSGLLDVLVKIDALVAFHGMINQLRERIHVGMVLRDVEVDLISGAQESAPSPELYQMFGLGVLRHIRAVLPLIEKSGQVRTDQQPYDEEYLVDAERRVLQEARRMNDQPTYWHPKPISSGLDNNTDERKDRSNQMEPEETRQKERLYERLIAPNNRKKNDRPLVEPKMCSEPGCMKTFVRPCDLSKHEKTHSRQFKCPVPTCKYHEYGWPTEKEKDRHVADKHSGAPAKFECLFKPCPYISKRESNCKQHMEKAHGWTYVRSKTNGRKLTTTLETKSLVSVDRKSKSIRNYLAKVYSNASDVTELVRQLEVEQPAQGTVEGYLRIHRDAGGDPDKIPQAVQDERLRFHAPVLLRMLQNMSTDVRERFIDYYSNVNAVKSSEARAAINPHSSVKTTAEPPIEPQSSKNIHTERNLNNMDPLISRLTDV